MKRVMKRALADRAKLDLPQSSGSSLGGASSPPPVEASSSGTPTNPTRENGRIANSSSSPEGQPPLKIQRIASEEPSTLEQTTSMVVPTPISSTPLEKEVKSSTTASVPPSPRVGSQRADNVRSNTPSQNTNKRSRRESSGNNSQQNSTEQENDTSSAFYLQHQNRALAIELKSLQAQVRDLTHEREHRRKACLQALQALHSLQATWTSLETALGHEPPPAPVAPSSESTDMPSSTVGDSNETAVEWTTALHHALQSLGNQRKEKDSEENPVDPEHQSDSNGRGHVSRGPGEMRNLGVMAANITGRANCLQEWLWEVLRSKKLDLPPTDQFSEKEKIELKSELERLKGQASELMQSLDDMSVRERRLRRNIYRLDVGMITQKQLIQSVVAGTANIDEDPERIAVQKEAVLKGASGEDKNLRSENSPDEGSGVNSSVSAAAVATLQRELEDARKEVANREKSIDELNSRIRELELRVNEVSAKQRLDGEKEKLESFEAVSQKLAAAEEEVKELRQKLDSIREKWAQSSGNEKALVKSLEELQEKHLKKWNELTASDSPESENGESTAAEDQAKKITELEHKLRQALENVRQAESVRTNLRDALTTNESLQTALSELKAKSSSSHSEKPEKSERSEKSERHSKSSSNNNDNSATPSSSKGDNHNESKSHSSSSHHHREGGGSDRISAEKAEKLYRENKKMRKEIAQIIASKEGHKAKLERVEKEKNSLVEVNSRLLKQAAEKDEMNAKSLSSILHLKGLTEQLTQENENLEQQMKSSEQLALAARLATNAKERLAEELVREKTALEEEIKQLEKNHGETRSELKEKAAECANASAKTATLDAELTNLRKRCDEFVTETEDQRKEIRKLLDALDKAERSAKEAREQLAEVSKNTGSDHNSVFTTDQLTTQIQVLKNRLACPVCHYRDKECIIMRCRHMHCKQCVEERLANRSRRCPTCNNPFGRNDMEDIFLG